MQECWYISDQLHTSYTDVLDISYQERVYLIECINKKHEEQNKAWEKAEMNVKNKK